MTRSESEKSLHLEEARPTQASQEYINPAMRPMRSGEGLGGGEGTKAEGSGGLAMGLSRDTLKGGWHVLEEAGNGLAEDTKSAAKGIVLGAAEVGGDVITAAGTVVKAAVDSATEIGTDVALVARRTVDGVLVASREIGTGVEQVAASLVKGAIEAVGAVGTTAVDTVKDVVVGLVAGVKEVANTAMPPEGKSRKTTP